MGEKYMKLISMVEVVGLTLVESESIMLSQKLGGN